MERYVMRLYVAGNSLYSRQAEENLRNICKEYFDKSCVLEIIDVGKFPDKAEEDRVLAIPTLVIKQPAPERRMIGALSNRIRVLAGLGLE